MGSDIEWLKQLVQIMNQNDLAELSLEEEGRKVRLRKHGAELRAGGAMTLAPAHPAPAGGGGAAKAAKAGAGSGAGGGGGAAGAAAGAGGGEAAGAERAENVVEIVSPMVGTFYRAPSPEADPFVEPGDAVKEDTTLCLIEAMKVLNEIKAEMEGIVQEVLVSNGEAVEYGQPLFLIKRTK